MQWRCKFNKKDCDELFESIVIPDYTTVKIKGTNHKKIAMRFLREFDVNLNGLQLNNIGEFFKTCLKANPKNKLLLENALYGVKTRKLKKMRSVSKIKNNIKTLRNVAVNEELETGSLMKALNELKTSHGIELSKEASDWKPKIKLVAMKSFKTLWAKGVKGPADTVDTDETGDRGAKFYYNKPLFRVPQASFIYLKGNYEDFEPGFYEFIEYMMDIIEKRKKAKKKEYSIDRTIFLATTAATIEDVDMENNIISIHTNGNDRPTFKGTPEFLDKSDETKIKGYIKDHPDIPIAAAQGGGPGGGPPPM